MFFKKLGQRRALAIAKVTVAACLVIREGSIVNIRIALGAVAPTVIRGSRTESYLEGHPLKEEVIAWAGQLISEESRAISDIRSTEEYRNEMTGLRTNNFYGTTVLIIKVPGACVWILGVF